MQAFAREYRDRVSFYGYLQWLAATQLEQAQEKATAAGGAIGLYLDLAVGVAADGAEAWSDQEVLVNAVRIGAPPDDFNPNGQNWGLLPFSPHALRARRYHPFINLLRQSMRHAGALRIDHVLGPARSFWLPENIDPDRPPAALKEDQTLAFHRFLGRMPAVLKVIQLEDALGAIEQANLPGTIDEHPNWRRKISVPLEELAADQGLLVLVRLFAGTSDQASTT